MGDHADYGHIRPAARGRNRRGDVSVTVDGCVGETQTLQLADQIAQQHQLAGRARIRVGTLARLRIVRDVSQEPFEHRGGHGVVVCGASPLRGA